MNLRRSEIEPAGVNIWEKKMRSKFQISSVIHRTRTCRRSVERGADSLVLERQLFRCYPGDFLGVVRLSLNVFYFFIIHTLVFFPFLPIIN